MKEFIVAAAIHIDADYVFENQPINITNGFVIVGRRHSDCYTTIESLYSIINAKNRIKEVKDLAPRGNQGFITSLNRYVGREEALKIALENNQIKYGAKSMSQSDELISENLY